MPVQVTNLSCSLLTVSLNTGDSLHLAPREQSRALADLEIANNPWLDELQRRRLVSVTPVRGAGDPGRAAIRRRPARRRTGGRRERQP